MVRGGIRSNPESQISDAPCKCSIIRQKGSSIKLLPNGQAAALHLRECRKTFHSLAVIATHAGDFSRAHLTSA
jgi:hypothetical protein